MYGNYFRGGVHFTNNNSLVDNVELNDKLSNNMGNLAVLLSDGFGNYHETSEFPTDGYVYNFEKSGCIDSNGNIVRDSLLYNFDTKMVTIETDVTIKCYLYFEIEKVFAIYSDTDNSLRFYNNLDYDIIHTQETYNELAITSVYTDFLDEIYTVDFDAHITTTPWFEHAEDIISIYIEDNIVVYNPRGWFSNLENVSFIDVNNLDVSETDYLGYLFSRTGYNAESFKIVGLENWNTQNVTTMGIMFAYAGYNATTWSIGDLSNWNISKVDSLDGMFRHAGHSAKTWNIGTLSTWDTSNVNDMFDFLCQAGYNAEKINMDLSNWNTSKVENMQGAFSSFGYNASEFSIGDLSKKDVTRGDGTNYTAWDTSNVTNMLVMFNNTGYSAQWSMNLSNWNVPNVTSYWNFSAGNENKIIEPNWVT